MGVMRVMNFTHGCLLLLGSYITYFLFTDFGVDPILSLLVVIPVLFGVGVLFYYIVVHPVLTRPFLEDNTMLLSFGGFLVVYNLFTAFWTDNLRGVNSSYLNTQITATTPWGSFVLSQAAIIGIVICFAAVVFLMLFLHYTSLGRAMRAASQDLNTARLMGVKVRRIYAISLGISSSLAGVAGVVVAMQFLFSPDYGFPYLLKAFGVILMGGMGSVTGTVWGGLSLGVAESMTTYVNGGEYGIWASGVAFAVILIALAVKAFRGTAR